MTRTLGRLFPLSEARRALSELGAIIVPTAARSSHVLLLLNLNFHNDSYLL
jgi:hypothetical protein